MTTETIKNRQWVKKLKEISKSLTVLMLNGLSKVSQLLKLFALYITVQTRNLIEFFQTAFHYYSNISFLKTDLTLLGSYIFKSPYRISKNFLKSHHATEINAYGETPLLTMELIAKECGLTSDDTVFELGCGRGRTCFWLHHFIKCRVVGVEFIPEFVKKANQIVNFFQLDSINFQLEDMMQTDLSEATVIYLYGTCLDEATISVLIEKMEKLPSGTKIITVSYPLTEYAQKPFLEVMKIFPAKFTWGNTEVFLHLIK